MDKNRFYCKTEGSILKNLFELLQKNIKNGSFNLSKECIKFKQTDSHGKTLIAFEMEADNFISYSYNYCQQSFSIGLNLLQTYKDIKTIKIKDILSLVIEKKDESRMVMETVNKDKTRLSTSYIKIQDFQVLEIDLPEGYNHQATINIPSKDYLKIIKDLVTMDAPYIEISTYPKLIKFSCKSNDINERVIVIGDGNDDPNNLIHTQKFETKQFARIQKISSLGNKIQVFQTKNLPLLLKCNIGELGKISVYLKDITQYDGHVDSDDESEDDD